MAKVIVNTDEVPKSMAGYSQMVLLRRREMGNVAYASMGAIRLYYQQYGSLDDFTGKTIN